MYTYSDCFFDLFCFTYLDLTDDLSDDMTDDLTDDCLDSKLLLRCEPDLSVFESDIKLN